MPTVTKLTIMDRIRRQAGWLAVVLVVSSAMFVAGVLVGRGQAPITFAVDDLDVELEAERLQSEAEAQQRYRAAADTDLKFHEDLRNARPERATRSRTKPVTKPPASKPAAKPASPRPAAPRTKAPPLPAEGAWTLQVAAVRDGAAADKLVAKLVDKGFPAFRTRAAIEGKGDWFRVRVGRFRTRAAAVPTMERLKKLGQRSFLIQNN